MQGNKGLYQKDDQMTLERDRMEGRSRALRT
jgi:hypothetical protein